MLYFTRIILLGESNIGKESFELFFQRKISVPILRYNWTQRAEIMKEIFAEDVKRTLFIVITKFGNDPLAGFEELFRRKAVFVYRDGEQFAVNGRFHVPLLDITEFNTGLYLLFKEIEAFDWKEMWMKSRL